MKYIDKVKDIKFLTMNNGIFGAKDQIYSVLIVSES